MPLPPKLIVFIRPRSRVTVPCRDTPPDPARRKTSRRRGTHGVRTALVALLAVLLCLPWTVRGSGSYRSSAPRRVRGATAIDTDRFELGRRLYSGMLRLGEPDPALAAAQEEPLKALARRLPSGEARSAERLQTLPGRLSDAQFQALKYFLQLRFELAE